MHRSAARLATIVLATVSVALAHDHGSGAAPGAPSRAQQAFERLRALEGTWTGKGGEAGGEASETTIVYKVTAAGSVVMETLFPGQPYEMVSMYHVDGDDLVMTHYCAGRNQPHMKATKITDGAIEFEFVSGTNIKPGDDHMHALKIAFPAAGRLHAEWTSWKDGKPGHKAVFDVSKS